MAVCIAYFDADSPDDPKKRTMSVAGYIATEKNWLAFSNRWNDVLKRADLSSFHMKDFADFKGDFSHGWRDDESRRRQLIRDLTGVIRRAVRQAFSSSLSLDDYDEIDRDYEFHERAARPYGLLAGAIMNRAQRWSDRNHPRDDVVFVFEEGDTDQREVVVLANETGGKFGHPPIFVPKTWTERGKTFYLRPFEACDFVAYEHANFPILVGTGKQARGSMLHLAATVRGADSGGGYNKESLLNICRVLRIPKRKVQ